MRRTVLFLTILFTCLLSDLLTKNLVEDNFPVNHATQVIGDYLRFTPVYNTGSVFGGFQGNPRIFHILQGIGILVLSVYFWKYGSRDSLSVISYGLLLGGASGNFTDKFYRLGVLDFIDMGVGNMRWFVYNVADIWIFFGFLVLLFIFIREDRRGRRKKHAT